MNRFIMLTRKAWLPAIGAAILIYSLIGFSLVPFLVQHYTPHLAARLLKRQAAVREVQFNPFSFTFEAKDASLNEADGQPVFGLTRLFLNFEPARSLFRRAFAFSDLRLEGPSANLVLDADGTLNLARIADSLPPPEQPPPPPSDEPPTRVVLDHIGLTEGTLKFTDLAQPTPVTETVEHLDLELNGISTLPDRQGAYRIEAGLPNGGKLAWRGDMSLRPLASKGELKVDDFRLATLWNFARNRLNLAEPAGAIGLSARYTFSRAQGKTELAVSEGAFKLAGLRLSPPGAKEAWLNLEEIGFERASLDLAGRAIRVPSILIRKGEIRAFLNEAGEIDWRTLLKPGPAGGASRPAPPPPPATGPPPPAPPWRVTVESLKVAELALRYADASRQSPFAVSVGDFGLELGAEAEAGAGPPKARIDNLAAHLDRVALTQPGKPAPLFGWDSFALDGGRLDLEKREAAVQRAVLKGGRGALVREADGTLRPLEVFGAKSPGGPAPNPGASPPAANPPEAQPWRFELGEFALQGFGVALTDRSFSPELAYQLDDVQATVKHLANDGKTPLAFDARLKVRQGGALEMSGTASPSGDTAQAKLRIDRFDLKPLQPIVSRFAALTLESADLSTDLNVDFHRTEPNPSVKASGGVIVNGLSLKEAKGGKRFLAWKTLTMNGIDFGLAPDKLVVKETRIVQPDTVIAIAKDRSTNIAAVLKPQTPAAPARRAAKDTPRPKPDEGKPSSKPFPVTVERVRVDDGLVDFSDMSLVLPFATRVHDFDGSVTGISLKPKDRASMKFEGRVEQYGEAKVDGSLSPMDMKNFSDIKVAFRNVAMVPLSPYSATFAGRKIESGKLDLDLRYRIENHRLKSENKIVLENFTLGETVESPNALNLPLDLAIALLTDSEGKINASVPVEGSVDDPKFSYGTLVWDAVVTLVTKVVTAPFNAIASLFGGSGEPLDTVLFEPAKTAIPPPEREKLAKIAEALAKRPKLKLTVHSRFNPKLDGEALKSLEIRRALAQKLDVELKPGEEPDQVAFGSAETQRALEKLAAERGVSADALEADYLKETGKPPQRVGALAGLVGRASDTPDFYEKLFRRLVDATPLPPNALETLASQRGLAVAAELTGRPGFDRARLTLDKTESTNDSVDNKVPSRLELSAE